MNAMKRCSVGRHQAEIVPRMTPSLSQGNLFRTLWLLTLACVLCACASPPIAREPAHHSSAAWRTIGASVEGRPIDAITVGGGPRRMLLIGGIHGDEREGLGAVDRAVEIAHAHGHAWTTTIVRDMNPDGTARGTRTNARGIDLNRNWPARNFKPGRARGAQPLCEPETLAVHALIEDIRPSIVVVFHSMRSGPLVNFDGPARAYADAFALAASHDGAAWRVEPSMGYATPGSLGSWFGIDQSLPILTIEFRRGARDVTDETARALHAIYAARRKESLSSTHRAER